MKRYHFDCLAPDEEGIELPDIKAVQQEAAITLAQMAEDGMPGKDGGRHMAIAVRDD